MTKETPKTSLLLLCLLPFFNFTSLISCSWFCGPCAGILRIILIRFTVNCEHDLSWIYHRIESLRSASSLLSPSFPYLILATSSRPPASYNPYTRVSDQFQALREHCGKWNPPNLKVNFRRRRFLCSIYRHREPTSFPWKLPRRSPTWFLDASKNGSQ